MTRDEAVRVREAVTITELTTNIRRIATEVHFKKEDGLPKECVANLDVINTIPKELLKEFIATVDDIKLEAIEKALKFALDLNK